MTEITVKFITLGCKTNMYESEAMAELPREVVSKTDVFAFLHENLLGRTYSSLDKGIGKITAQCGDRFLIKYSSGATELLSLSQMAEGRDKTAKYTPKKSEKAQIAVNTSNRIVSTQNFKVGKRVSHIHFGDGRITALTSSGSSTIATVVFEKSKETKRFMLQDVVKNKLLRLIN